MKLIATSIASWRRIPRLLNQRMKTSVVVLTRPTWMKHQLVQHQKMTTSHRLETMAHRHPHRHQLKIGASRISHRMRTTALRQKKTLAGLLRSLTLNLRLNDQRESTEPARITVATKVRGKVNTTVGHQGGVVIDVNVE